MAIILVLLILVAIIFGIIFMLKKTLQMQKQRNQKAIDMGAKDVMIASHIEGLGIASNTFCEIFRFDDKILIDANPHKFEISLEKVRAVVVKDERELIEQGKSVVGRAIIGTLLVPGLGTIVGGMSGIGTKTKKGILNHFLIINYTDSQGELAAVTFLNNINLIKMNQFCADLNKSINQKYQEVVQL
jgi:hypothetical protein